MRLEILYLTLVYRLRRYRLQKRVERLTSRLEEAEAALLDVLDFLPEFQKEIGENKDTLRKLKTELLDLDVQFNFFRRLPHSSTQKKGRKKR
jgi:predicted  nucleic acid-binding Zn-ribbon protein